MCIPAGQTVMLGAIILSIAVISLRGSISDLHVSAPAA
jgi:hypothetical protein